MCRTVALAPLTMLINHYPITSICNFTRLNSLPRDSRTPVSHSASTSFSLTMAVYRPSPPHTSRRYSPEVVAATMAYFLPQSYRRALASRCSTSPRCASCTEIHPTRKLVRVFGVVECLHTRHAAMQALSLEVVVLEIFSCKPYATAKFRLPADGAQCKFAR